MSSQIAAIKQANKYFEFLTSRPKKHYSSRDEYMSDLNAWFEETYYIWNLTAKFPYYFAQQQVSHRLRNRSSNVQNNTQGSGQTNPNVQSRNNFSSSGQQSQDEFDGIQCRIPPMWKRLAAEFIDFLILFFLKLVLTFVAADFFDLIDWDKIGDDLFQIDSKIEYKAVIQMTHRIVLLELVHRVVVCAFETYWLSSGSQGRLGGATPGKSIMGLRVVRCDSAVDLPRAPNEHILQTQIIIRPGKDLGLQTSFMRALIKNVVLTFFIPASFALLYFRHNRTGYDMVCNTIVVEEPILRHTTPHQN